MRPLLLTLLLTACGTLRAASRPPPDEEAPAWSTPEGRDKARLDLVSLLLDANNVDGALTLIAQLRTDGFKGPDLDLLHGQALARAGLSDDADAMLSGIPRRHPAYPAACNERGLLLMERGDLTGALAAFDDATKADESSASFWNNLGFALQSSGRPEDAVVALRRSLALNSAQPRTRNNLGFALIAAGRESEAYRVFRAGSTEADARYNLGLGLELRGQLDRAAVAYADALTANPTHAQAQEGLARVQTGGSGGAGPQKPSPSAVEFL